MSTQHHDDLPYDGPLVTIAIPTFNRARMLKECIEAALAQTYDGIEVLVSDNASSDETQIILSQIADRRLRVLRQDRNIGLFSNLNACLSHAKGTFIIFIPDDDRPAPWLVQRCVDLVKLRSNIPVVISLSDFHAEAFGTRKAARVSHSHATGIADGIEILSEFLNDRITVTMCSVMMRVDLLRARGGIPASYGHTADVAAWAPLLFFGNAGLVNEACATFRFHGTSQTSKLDIEAILDDGRKVSRLLQELIDAHVLDSRKRNTIRKQAWRCFARRALITLSDYRSSGGDLRRVLKALWTIRGDLVLTDPISALRLAAIVVLPAKITVELRRLKHNWLERAA